MQNITSHTVSVIIELVIIAVVHFLWNRKTNRLKFDALTAIYSLLLIIFGIVLPLESALHHGLISPTLWVTAAYIIGAIIVASTTFMKFKFLHPGGHECMEAEICACLSQNQVTMRNLGRGIHSVVLFSKSLTILVLLGNIISLLVS